MIKKIFGKLVGNKQVGRTLNEGGLFDVLNQLQENNKEVQQDLSETVYFICLKHLSESLGKMAWEKREITEKKGKETIFDNKLDILLNIRPNPYQSAITFWQTLEMSRNHHGNAYVYIERDRNGKLSNLWQLPSDEVQIWIDNKGIFGVENGVWYVWNDSKTGNSYSFFKEEILHFKTHITWDGLSGVPVRDILRVQLNTQKSALNFLKKLYTSGTMGTKVIVNYTGELSDKNADNLTEKIGRFIKSEHNGTFIPLPIGYQAQLLDMKLADAQFFENNNNTALQIAAAFGIKPNVINDYTKSSYSNSESQQLDFYVNTLQPLFSIYEQELTYKLLTPEELGQGIRLSINEDTIFKMDNKTKSEVYSTYLQNFVMTPNEVREALNLPYVEGGDKLVGNGNAITLEMAGQQYKKGDDVIEKKENTTD